MSRPVSRGFKDISLSFKRNPLTNDVVVLKNEDAIKKSVMNLVRTQIGERFFNPLIGTTIESNLFELQNEELVAFLEPEIKTLLNNFEKRIQVTRVDVDVPEDTYDLNIRIEYEIVGLGIPTQTIDFLLQPSRI